MRQEEVIKSFNELKTKLSNLANKQENYKFGSKSKVNTEDTSESQQILIFDTEDISLQKEL